MYALIDKLTLEKNAKEAIAHIQTPNHFSNGQVYTLQTLAPVPLYSFSYRPTGSRFCLKGQILYPQQFFPPFPPICNNDAAADVGGGGC